MEFWKLFIFIFAVCVLFAQICYVRYFQNIDKSLRHLNSCIIILSHRISNVEKAAGIKPTAISIPEDRARIHVLFNEEDLKDKES